MAKNCYISAPSSLDVSTLLHALHERGLKVLTSRDVDPNDLGHSAVENMIRQADLVVGVITTPGKSSNVMFELGQAWSLKRKVILFVGEKSGHLPFDLSQSLIIRAPISNREAVTFALDQVLASPALERWELPNIPTSTRELGGQSVQLIHKFETEIMARGGAASEEFVAEVLRSSGVDVVSEVQRKDYGADFAVWSDGLQPWVGNPLMIEIKGRYQGSKHLAQSAKRLSEIVMRSGTLYGLLLFSELPVKPYNRSIPSNILVMSIPELVRKMEKGSFVEVIREVRNRRVHGGLI